jgi:hypothetical protein
VLLFAGAEIKTAVFYVDKTTRGRGAVVFQAVRQRWGKRRFIAVAEVRGMPGVCFHINDRGGPLFPVSLQQGSSFIERSGRARIRATGVALAQTCCLALAPPNLPVGFAHKLKSGPAYLPKATSCAEKGSTLAKYARQRSGRLQLTPECLTYLGLLAAGGDPSAKIGTRLGGTGVLSVGHFGSVNCPNAQAAASGRFFRTTNQHYVRGGVQEEVENALSRKKVHILSMAAFVQKAMGSTKAMIMPCHLPDPPATITYLTKRDFAVDVSAEAELKLPPDTKIEVDVDLVVLVLTGPDKAWATYKVGQSAMSPEPAPVKSAFALEVAAVCAPLAARIFADAHKTAARATPFFHAVDSFSAANSAAEWGSVPKDAVYAAAFTLERCPKHWKDDQCQLVDNFEGFVQYDPKGRHKIEHCRWALEDSSQWTVLAGFSDYVTEPLQGFVRAPVPLVRECARDILDAFKIVNASPADFAKLRAARSAPTGLSVTVRGNCKLFLLSTILLVMERCQSQFGVEFSTGRVFGAVQVFTFVTLCCRPFLVHVIP